MKRILRATIWVILAALTSSGAAFAQKGAISGITFSSSGRPAAGVNVAICETLATISASVTSNVATLTFASNPQTAGFVANYTLTVYGFSGADTYFNGSYAIASTSATTISFALVHANAAAGTNGSVYQTGSSTQACAPLSTLYTDYTGATTTTNPFTSDGLGNYTAWTTSGYYEVQLYGPSVTTTVYFTTTPLQLSPGAGFNLAIPGVNPALTISGATSGSAGFTVASIAGSTHLIQLPTVDPARKQCYTINAVGNPESSAWQDCALVWAETDLIAQTAAVNTTQIFTTGTGLGAGQYEVSWSAKVTTAGGATSTLGAMTITYVDPDGTTQTIVAGALSKAGVIETTDTGNVTTTVLLGVPLTLNCGAATNISIAFAYAANPANSMVYNLHVRVTGKV